LRLTLQVDFQDDARHLSVIRATTNALTANAVDRVSVSAAVTTDTGALALDGIRTTPRTPTTIWSWAPISPRLVP
jgi:hypothetical protein